MRIRPRDIYATFGRLANEDELAAVIVGPGFLIAQPILLPWLIFDELATAAYRGWRAALGHWRIL